MGERRAFLEAIAAEPESDTPRLVYADWLEENGDARRAGFIRAQCELARLPEAEPRRAELCRVAGELFDPAWPPAGLGVRGWRRGFPWRWHCTDAELLAALDADYGPMFETSLTLPRRLARPDGWAGRLAAHPLLYSVRRLCGFDPTLIASPHLTNVKSLEACGFEGVRALCDPPAGFRLTRLALARPHRLTGGLRTHVLVGMAVRLVATHPAFAGLKSLALDGNDLNEQALAELLASPTLSRSLRLEVGAMRWPVPAELRGRFDRLSRFG